MARLAAWLGLADRSFDGVLQWVLELRREIGIPHTLAGIGVRAEHAKPFAPQALNDPSPGGNPLPRTKQYFERLYLNCINGALKAA
jgi:alcohol dehydrogenase class IV